MHNGQPTGPPLRLAAAVLALAGCTAHLSQGEGQPAGDLAVINVGSTVVRQIDGQHRRGGAFDVEAFEVAPGPHRLVLVFELPARSLGLKSLPAQAGIGVCELAFEARSGRQYYLLARPLGDFNSPRWSGAWEALVRDPAIASDDDVVARCQGTQPMETPTPFIAGTSSAAAAPPAAAGALAVAVPTALPLPPADPLHIGAWHLPELAHASPADLAAAAAVIGTNFDVLTIAPALAPDALLAALGEAWATTSTANETAFYRRDVVRPCAQPPPVTPCLEAIDGAPGNGGSMMLRLPPAEGRP